MELIKFIEKNGEEKLHELGIHFYKYGDLTVYQYSQIESFPFKRNPVVIESRGIILDNNLKVIARPFDRFFNYGEDDISPNINWSECHIYKKIDGSLIKIFHYNGNWHAGTKKTVYGNTDVNGFNVMFKDLVYKAFNVNTQEEFNFIFEGFEGSTLIFELTSRENRVVTPYEGTQIWLLAVRDNVTGNYIDINEVILKFKEDNKFDKYSIKLPKKFTFDSYSACAKAAEELPDLKEGYVVYNSLNVPIFKIKSPAYVAAHQLRGNGLSHNNALELVINFEESEYLSLFPDGKIILDKYINVRNDLFDSLDFIWEKYKAAHTIKDFVLTIGNYSERAILIEKYKNKDKTFLEIFNEFLYSRRKNFVSKFLKR